MAVTAIDMQKASAGNYLRRAFIEDLRKGSKLVDYLKWETTDALQITAFRWKDLPTPAFRALNATPIEATGTTEQIQAAVYDIAKYSDVDRNIVRDKSLIEPARKTQDKMTARAMSLFLVNQLVNGDGAVDPNGFDGLKVQIAALPSSQTIAGGSLDLSTSALRGTNGYAFMNLVDQVIDATEGMPDVLVMGRTLKQAFADIARQKQQWKTVTDALGRRVEEYDGIPVIEAGYRIDQSTEIIPTNFDGSTGITSLFAVKFDTEGVVMLQQYPLEVIDHGLMESVPKYRTEVTWPVGMMIRGKRTAARLSGIKVA